MKLSEGLVSQFVSITKDTETKKAETCRGTTVKKGDDIFVQLDGSDVLTPVITTAELGDNERVVVEIRDHTATVMGNISSPSSGKEYVLKLSEEASKEASKTATNFLRFDGSGLVVGNLSSQTLGKNTLMGNDGFYIRDGTTTLAYFGDSSISLGTNSDSSTIYLCGNKGYISRNGTLLDIWSSDMRLFADYGLELVARLGNDGESRLAIEGHIISGSAVDIRFTGETSLIGNLTVSGNIYLPNGSTVTTSDEREKRNIMPIGYSESVLEQLYSKLLPKTFRRDDGIKDQIHIGFVAQDIAQALKELGVDNEEHFGFLDHEYWTDEKTDEPRDRYGLVYEEFIALNTYMIQKQHKALDALAQRVAELEKGA